MAYDSKEIQENYRKDISKKQYILAHSNSRPTGNGSPKPITAPSKLRNGERVWSF